MTRNTKLTATALAAALSMTAHAHAQFAVFDDVQSGIAGVTGVLTPEDQGGDSEFDVGDRSPRENPAAVNQPQDTSRDDRRANALDNDPNNDDVFVPERDVNRD